MNISIICVNQYNGTWTREQSARHAKRTLREGGVVRFAYFNKLTKLICIRIKDNLYRNPNIESGFYIYYLNRDQNFRVL